MSWGGRGAAGVGGAAVRAGARRGRGRGRGAGARSRAAAAGGFARARGGAGRAWSPGWTRTASAVAAAAAAVPAGTFLVGDAHDPPAGPFDVVGRGAAARARDQPGGRAARRPPGWAGGRGDRVGAGAGVRRAGVRRGARPVAAAAPAAPAGRRRSPSRRGCGSWSSWPGCGWTWSTRWLPVRLPRRGRAARPAAGRRASGGMRRSTGPARPRCAPRCWTGWPRTAPRPAATACTTCSASLLARPA